MMITKKFVALVVAIVGLLAAQASAGAPGTARRQPQRTQPRAAQPQREAPLRHAQPHRDLHQDHRAPHRAPHQGGDRWVRVPIAPYPWHHWAPYAPRVLPIAPYPWQDHVWVPTVYETRTALERVWVPPVQEMRLVRREVWVPATPLHPGYMRHFDSYELVEVREGYYVDRYVTRSVCVRPGHWGVGAQVRMIGGW